MDGIGSVSTLTTAAAQPFLTSRATPVAESPAAVGGSAAADGTGAPSANFSADYAMSLLARVTHASADQALALIQSIANAGAGQP
jgi:hypothetical protein